MSDSSDNEDLSKFADAVDTTFLNNDMYKNIDNPEKNQTVPKQVQNVPSNQKSQRYLEVHSHYNDVQVGKELQMKLAKKLSALIEKNIEFVETDSKVREHEVVGGIRLFSNSNNFLSVDLEPDDNTAEHNKACKSRMKQIKKKQSKDVLQSLVVEGSYILSQEETRLWRSRRKEKLYRYRRCKGKLLSLDI